MAARKDCLSKQLSCNRQGTILVEFCIFSKLVFKSCSSLGDSIVNKSSLGGLGTSGGIYVDLEGNEYVVLLDRRSTYGPFENRITALSHSW
jgi:predicted HAD superfamily phosphohydrolase